MRGIMEYKNPSYICSHYSKNKSCDRNLIYEENINQFVLRFCNLKNIKYEKTKEYMRTIIDRIVVYPNNEFEIYYLDKSYACFKDNCIKYV
jgi:hypothetical protein